MSIEYRHNTSSEKEILTHLQSVDEDFVVPLSQRVNIDEYTHILCKKCQRVYFVFQIYKFYANSSQ